MDTSPDASGENVHPQSLQIQTLPDGQPKGLFRKLLRLRPLCLQQDAERVQLPRTGILEQKGHQEGISVPA